MRNTGSDNTRVSSILSAALMLALFGAPLAAVAQADTIRLKNGSVIKGKVTSFADEQFVVLLDSGSGRSMSKAMIYIADIAKIDFDAATDAATTSSAPRDTSTVRDNPGTATEENVTRPNPARDNTARDNTSGTPPVDPRLGKSNSARNRGKEVKAAEPPAPVTDDQPAAKEPEVKQPEVKQPAGGEETAGEAPPRKPLANARTTNVDVAAKRDWTSSGVIVRRGDRVRITATGTIQLDAGGQASGPEGIDLGDTKKLMGERPTGGLIGVIGADNDDFVFIGRAAEFTASRDGLLFLSVNEGTLTDNSGSFKAVIEIQAARPGARQ